MEAIRQRLASALFSPAGLQAVGQSTLGQGVLELQGWMPRHTGLLGVGGVDYGVPPTPRCPLCNDEKMACGD